MKTLKLLFLACIFLFPFSACDDDEGVSLTEWPRVDAYDHAVIWRWNQLFLELDRYAAGYRPGPSAHALAYLGFSAYEAVAPGMPGYQSLAGLYPGLSIPEFDETLEYYWPEVINESYAYLLKLFFSHLQNTHPDIFQKIEETRLALRTQYAGQTNPDVFARSDARGNSVAAAIYAWETTDVVAHNAFLNPHPPFNGAIGPEFWQPTFPDFTSATHPFWGNVRTFALSDVEQLANPPLPYSEMQGSDFFNQAMEVFTEVQNIKTNGPNAFEKRWKAELWSDDIIGLTFSPAARMIGVANQVIREESSNLAEAVELYAKLGMALSDASVAVWESKYIYNRVRPISYIRSVIGASLPGAATFTPVLNDLVNNVQGVTPASPGYPSAHGGFGGAGGKILSSFFEFTPEHPGSYIFVDECHQYRSEFLGTPRVFTSFKNMAEEDAYSRILLGVNFRADCEEGLRLGELAAQRVLELPWKE